MRINKESDILYAFDDIKDELEKAKASLAILPAVFNRFIYLFIQGVEQFSDTNVFLNHVYTDLKHNWGGVGQPLSVTIYFKFDYVPLSKRSKIEELLKKLFSEFKLRNTEIKFIKEEGVYCKFLKDIK